MPQLFLHRKNHVVQETWNGTGKSSVSSLVRISTHSLLHAHGWDPLVPTATGVYDGPQEAPRYFIVGGEYQGLNLLCVNWVGMRCAEKAVNDLDQ
jgi:hypothetical protein